MRREHRAYQTAGIATEQGDNLSLAAAPGAQLHPDGALPTGATQPARIGSARHGGAAIRRPGAVMHAQHEIQPLAGAGRAALQGRAHKRLVRSLVVKLGLPIEVCGCGVGIVVRLVLRPNLGPQAVVGALCREARERSRWRGPGGAGRHAWTVSEQGTGQSAGSRRESRTLVCPVRRRWRRWRRRR